jgi:alkylation response protein AidB-like acyl-CoA dehydrogenase
MTTEVSAADAVALQTSISQALTAASPSARVRELMATETGWDRAEWQRLCRELGAAGIAVDEQYGGSGMSSREAGLLFEAAGRVLLCAPLLAVAGLAIPLLAAVGDVDVNARLLPQLVAGDVIATVVTADRDGRHGVEHLGVVAAGDRLTGRAGYVVDGANADVILVPARTADGLGVFLVNASAPGLSVTPLVTLDQTRKQAHLDFANAPATQVGSGDATAAVRTAYDVARAMLACEQVGVAAQCLQMTVEFAKTRVQFGRPIGSFQAVKQKLAGLLINSESARSAATAAAQAAADGSPDLAWIAAVAKAYGSETTSVVTAETIQLHGGIGFTWDHDAHLYFKRARASEEMLGTPRELYEQIAAHVAAS